MSDTDTDTDTPTDTTSVDTTSVERSVVLDADVETVIEALTDPDLLSTWLGDWRTDDDGDVVRTDDGVDRRVERVEAEFPGAVHWRWSPLSAPDATSDVVFVVSREMDRARLTVTETRSASWVGCLLTLGAVLASRHLVAA
ncbi:MAG TPA: hypothetical protein PLV93_08275 [Microthrixaceae bacterium]|nr:hypothetical protein [Microthrixaceae bacterium]HNI35383.1 hypothetical protein [Microthrixaceae bacterium]